MGKGLFKLSNEPVKAFNINIIYIQGFSLKFFHDRSCNGIHFIEIVLVTHQCLRMVAQFFGTKLIEFLLSYNSW
jgi:hypothetical protein